MIGEVIGNYQLVRQLGEGGMGAVYLGHHTLLGRRAAIKVLLPTLSARQDIVNRFFNEARATTSINDPGIVQIFDFGYHTDGSAFIVMELLDGESLDARLSKLGRLPAYDALRLCRQLAGSLGAAHAQGIVHRDLKPENVFLVRDPEVASGERPKILDFGIAKLSDDRPDTMKTHTGALMGTPLYMSPEQCRSAAELDHRSDIYALGCVLFHLLVGRPPFEGDGLGDIIAAHLREPAPVPSSRMPGIGRETDALVLRCLAKAPADRFQSMGELVAAIGDLLPYVTAPDSATVFVPGFQAGSSHHPSRPGSRPGTPVPPAPSVPAMASVRGTRPSSQVPAAQPTTLGASIGQVAHGTAARGGRGWVLGAVAVVGVIGTAVTLAIVLRAGGGVGRGGVEGGGGDSTAAAATADASTVTIALDANVAIPAAPDAAVVVDAGVPDAPPAPPLDATAPDAPPLDAIEPDAAPLDAPKKHRPQRPRPQPPGSASPAACDRSVDTDCDGIPDIR